MQHKSVIKYHERMNEVHENTTNEQTIELTCIWYFFRRSNRSSSVSPWGNLKNANTHSAYMCRCAVPVTRRRIYLVIYFHLAASRYSVHLGFFLLWPGANHRSRNNKLLVAFGSFVRIYFCSHLTLIGDDLATFNLAPKNEWPIDDWIQFRPINSIPFFRIHWSGIFSIGLCSDNCFGCRMGW